MTGPAHPTRVLGVDRVDGLPYEVLFRPGRRPLVPPGLQTLMPDAGSIVLSGPAGVEIEFDEDDPAAVMAWLRSATTVTAVDGHPVEVAAPPGDVFDHGEEGDDDVV